MVVHIDELAAWNGREVFDASGRALGTIVGLGYPRRKFGSAWLLVQTQPGKRVLAPADQMSSSDGRLVLPYPKTYVEDAPGPEEGQTLSKAEERRLCLYYGLDSALPNSGCRRGCGLCQAMRRAQVLENLRS